MSNTMRAGGLSASRQNMDLAILATQGWLSLTPTAFRDGVLARVTRRAFDSGSSVFRLGDPSDGIWGILNGAVQIELPTATRLPTLAHFAIPGFWFGVGPLVRDMPRRVGVTATEPSVLVRLSPADCRALLAEHPGDWRWMALLSTMETDIALGVAADLLLTAPVQRVIATLLRIAGMRNGSFPPFVPHPISLSQERLALLCNLSRTVVSGALKELLLRGLIRIEYRRITVLDAPGMLALLNEG